MRTPAAALILATAVVAAARSPVPMPVPVPPSADRPAGLVDTPRRAPGGSAADSHIHFSVIFLDPSGILAPYAAQIESNLLAACEMWAAHLTASAPVSIEVLVQNAAIPTATGRSLSAGFVGTFGGFFTYDQGMAAEIRTGIDFNGATPDVEITLGNTYLTNELWFDPDPVARTAPVPANRTDAVSVFLHEIGHALVFNGWRHSTTGTLPADYQGTFDRHAFFDGSNLFFSAPLADARYGGPVPLTFGNYGHVGNASPRPGTDLILDLMNGVVYFRGTRYSISPIDLDVAADTGIQVVIPCYANCDGSAAAPALNVADFTCFLQRFAQMDPYANCDLSTNPPTLNVADFTCFLQEFAAGCP